MPSKPLFDPDDLGFGVADTADFSIADLGFDRASLATARFNHSIVRPDDGESVLAYIDRVFAILDGYGRADRRVDVNRGIRPVERPAPGMPPAPTVRIARRPLPVATGAPRDIVDYIDEHFIRADANIAREARKRADAAAFLGGGLGTVTDGTHTTLPGIVTDATRARRLVDAIRRDIVTRAGLTGHARAQYTRSIRKDARTLTGRYGYSVDDIVAALNDAD